MKVTCPECGNTWEWDESSVEPSVKCEACGYTVNVRRQAEPPSAAPPPALRKSWGPFVSPKPRGRVVSVLSVVTIVVSLVSIRSSLMQVGLLKRIVSANEIVDRNPDADEEEITAKVKAAGVLVTEEDVDANDQRERQIALISVAAFLAMFVTFLMWKYRAYKNLQSLNARQVRFSPGGAVGWYFCPFANLWKPCQVMTDIWHGSDPRRMGHPSGAAAGLVILWWCAWISDATFSSIVSRAGGAAESVEDMILATQFSIATLVTGIVSALLTLAVVLLVTKRQLDRNRAIQKPDEAENPYAATVLE